MEMKALLFDCDGLMFDTEIVAQRIWQEVADANHYTLPDDFFVQITGSEVKPSLFQDPVVGTMFQQAHAKRYDLNFWKSIQKDCLNKKGLLELFAYLKTKSYKIAICSSSPKVYVEILLNSVSKPLQYDLLLGGNLVSKKKPDPEIFLKAAEILEVAPEACLVLEDSKNGIIAAQRAHMHHCFIADTISKDEELKQMIEFERQDLSEIIELLEEISSKQNEAM